MMSEQEHLEKKRPGPEASPFEEQKRQKRPVDDDDWLLYEGDDAKDVDFANEANDDDECYDWFLYEGDSDSETLDGFTEHFRVIEADYTDAAAPRNEGEEKDGKRRCHKVRLCNKYQHVAKFDGLPVFELFKVRLKLNGGDSIIRGQLYGEIVKADSVYDLDNPIPISYYRVTPQKPDIINLDSDNQFVLLPLSGPNPRPPFSEDYTFGLDFAFKLNGKDIFTIGYEIENRELFDDGCGNCTVKVDSIFLRPSSARPSRRGGCFVARKVIGEPTADRILMGVYYAVYHGSWATVDVKLLEEGVSSFYGLIVARPCIFRSRIRLLTAERGKKVNVERDGKGEVDEESGLIKLTRSIVAVPAYSSLIIGAALYHEDGKTLICRGTTAFAAKPFGEKIKSISNNGIKTLMVRVQWDCHS